MARPGRAVLAGAALQGHARRAAEGVTQLGTVAEAPVAGEPRGGPHRAGVRRVDRLHDARAGRDVLVADRVPDDVAVLVAGAPGDLVLTGGLRVGAVHDGREGAEGAADVVGRRGDGALEKPMRDPAGCRCRSSS